MTRMAKLKRRANEVRNFPTNTCSASRHLRLMADGLAGKGYPMLTEEPKHCAESIYATIVSLWEARSALERITGKTWDVAITEAQK